MRTPTTLALTLLLLTFALPALAQDAAMDAMGAHPLAVAEHDSLGAYLVDAEGRTLYVVVDGDATVPCDGECADAWPPYTLAEDAAMGADAMEGDAMEGAMDGGIDDALIATVTRDDGTTQLTYAGHPLYYFVGDTEPGEVNCQAVAQFGGTWYVLSPDGEVITASVE